MDLKAQSVNFPIVFHFHQPVDNFDWVFKDAYEKCYKPLLAQIEVHPDVKFNLHFTGSFLEWYVENNPALIETVARLAKRGQIEILGGGYYEPIFAIIPREDRIQQMLKLRDFIKETFTLDVNGAWLSERVWEPHYPSFLREAGLSYIIVDDNHLRSCGISDTDAMYSYTTEDEGQVITVFPINQQLRYLAPWQAAWRAVDYLRSTISSAGDRLILFMSDAEKMGVWGTTQELCYQRGHPDDNFVPYIKALFDHLEWNVNNTTWLKSVTLSEYQGQYRSRGLIYFPNATYDKMEEWVLPTPSRRTRERLRKDLENHELPRSEEILKFLRGGFWRYFLVKYPEVNNMHKKMLWVRTKLKTVAREVRAHELVNQAWDEIYKAQANDCYWHGQFGGVYYAVFRHSVYKHLITAENLIDSLVAGGAEPELSSMTYPRVNFVDFFKDSKDELLVESANFNFYFSPDDGGVLFECDYKPLAYNVLNLMSRWEEAYHDPGRVVVDPARKSMLRDHVIYEKQLLVPFAREQYEDLGTFATKSYDAHIEAEGSDITITFKRAGAIRLPGRKKTVALKLSKEFHHANGSSSFSVAYSASKVGLSDEELGIFKQLVLAVDLPFFLNGDPDKVRFQVNSTCLRRNQTRKLPATTCSLRDGERGLQVDVGLAGFPPVNELWLYPIKTFSRMNERYEKTNQGSNLVVRIPLGALLNATTPPTVTWMFKELAGPD